MKRTFLSIGAVLLAFACTSDPPLPDSGSDSGSASSFFLEVIPGSSAPDQFPLEIPLASSRGDSEINVEFANALPSIAGLMVLDVGRDASVPYNGAVTLSARGVSEWIPGVTRSYTHEFPQRDDGAYSARLGEGVYTIVATPADQNLPPVSVTGVVIRAAAPAAAIEIRFASAEVAKVVTGQVYKVLSPPSFFTSPGSDMDIQAYKKGEGTALSQRVAVSSGSAGSTGFYALTLNPAEAVDGFELRVLPRRAGGSVPAKSIAVAPIALSGDVGTPVIIDLELGDVGELLPLVGTIRDKSGNPVSGAQIALTGTSINGGTFRSLVVATDADGSFIVNTLSGEMTLAVSTPENALAGSTEFSIRIPQGVRTFDTGALTCKSRTTVRGVVRTSSGSVVAKAAIRAVPIAYPNARGSLGSSAALTSTSSAGTFSLLLDDARWRLGAYPPVAFGASNAFQEVTIDAAAMESIVALPDPLVILPASVLSGQLTVKSGSAFLPLAFATVNCYRVSNGEAFLVGSASSDSSGRYSVLVPLR